MATSGWNDVKLSDIQRMQSRGSAAPPMRSKYRNEKCIVNGEKFDSRHEADVYLVLAAREKAGEITDLKRQVRWSLYCPTAITDRHAEVAVYVADYQWKDRAGHLHVGDAKGQRKRICPYPIKAKWLKLQEGIDIEEL